MALSNEQAKREMLGLINYSEHPDVEVLRAAIAAVPDFALRERLRHAIVAFLTSDAAWDQAVRQAGVNPLQDNLDHDTLAGG